MTYLVIKNKIRNIMRNMEYIVHLKENHDMRPGRGVEAIRQALRENGVDSSQRTQKIYPHSAAWLLYAGIMSPASRSNAIDWIRDTMKQFHRKKVLGEVTPIDILRSLFEDRASAEALDRVVINLATGDLYAVPRGREYETQVAYFRTERVAKKREQTLIVTQSQINREYFLKYHESIAKMN